VYSGLGYRRRILAKSYRLFDLQSLGAQRNQLHSGAGVRIRRMALLRLLKVGFLVARSHELVERGRSAVAQLSISSALRPPMPRMQSVLPCLLFEHAPTLVHRCQSTSTLTKSNNQSAWFGSAPRNLDRCSPLLVILLYRGTERRIFESVSDDGLKRFLLSNWKTGNSVHVRFVFVLANDETSGIGPSCGIVGRPHRPSLRLVVRLH